MQKIQKNLLQCIWFEAKQVLRVGRWMLLSSLDLSWHYGILMLHRHFIGVDIIFTIPDHLAMCYIASLWHKQFQYPILTI